MPDTLTILRSRINAVAPHAQHGAATRQPVALGAPCVDEVIDGGLMPGALHECFAASTADMAATAGFAAGLAHRFTDGHRTTVWIRQRFAEIETGRLHAPGLAALGLDPAHVIFVQVRNATDVLRAGLEAIRCGPLGAILIELWGMPAIVDLTTTRRLALAAENSGVTPFLLRADARPQPSSAATRWQVAAAPSRPLAANAPGLPVFDITLLRNRSGASGQRWRVEWDHDQHRFRDAASLSRRVDAVPVRRSSASAGQALARAG